MKNILLSPKDIYIEINGVKVAGIKNYKVTILKEVYNTNSSYSNLNYKIIPLKTLFQLELSKICLLENISYLDWVNLSNFNLVIVKPKSQIIFDDCNWTSLSESIASNNSIIQSLSLTATKRINCSYSVN